MNVLRGATDLPQLHATWFGFNKQLGLAQEYLEKYETQYHQLNDPSNFTVPTSPVSTDPEIYEAMSDLEDIDLRLKYLYQSIPHLQEGIHSPRRLMDGSTWNDILPFPENLAELHHNKANISMSWNRQTSSENKGKGRSQDDNRSLPVSPRMLNVGYGTPFHSSSHFFNRPDRQKFPLPASSVMSRQNILVRLGLPNTPAFQNLEDPLQRRNFPQSRQSNPFEQRNIVSLSGTHNHTHNLIINSDSNQHNQGLGGQGGRGNNPTGGGGGNEECRHDLYGNQDGDSNDNSNLSRVNNHFNSFPHHNGGDDPPGGDPPGGGGGGSNAPTRRGNPGNLRNDSQNQGLIPYGDTKATIRNDLKQDQLPVWDGNKNTAIEYFWKVQQLAALEGDIPQALGYWLWKSLKENSKIWWWFSTLPFSEQVRMRTHYLYYLKGIKDNYLG